MQLTGSTALAVDNDNLRKRIVALEMRLSEIAEGRIENFDACEDDAVWTLQEHARKALLNPFNTR